MKEGVVIKSTGSWFTVKSENNQIIVCKIKGNFRTKGIKSTNPVAVGDWVEYQILENKTGAKGQMLGIITDIRDRKNYIVRRSQNLSRLSHIIAANIDQVFLIATLNFPVTTTTFIDRFLASAEAYSIPAIILFNKTDLLNPYEKLLLDQLISTYTNIGYKCLETSSVTKTGIEDLMNLMKDKVSLFSGHSGVGKSTLINLMQPGLMLKTMEISDSHKTGKHTTSYSEMFPLDFGGYIIDTPGIKAYGMLNMEAWEISHYFPEIFRLSSDCQYNNCTHTHEPGCAVKEGVKNKIVAESRYISYLGLLEGDEKYRPAF
ncbi:MAG: ribosome small subunit-dependent GTPase A [Prolixibacteraceae bacterium]|nr:ribosome small subunit-dependent GTPase A [Prolixibacteraceae bacterium]MBN2775411.1 ribosome small subunit-dependent GTPase A [Prolixibacteraceae bacterium]